MAFVEDGFARLDLLLTLWKEIPHCSEIGFSVVGGNDSNTPAWDAAKKHDPAPFDASGTPCGIFLSWKADGRCCWNQFSELCFSEVA